MRKIFLALLLFLISLTTTQAQTKPIKSICQNTTTFRSNSYFQNNLKSLLYSFQSDDPDVVWGFYNRSVGQDPDVVWGFYLCRGDVSNDLCQQCVNAAARKVFDYCPDGKFALVWYDYCLLRYSNSSWTVSYSSFNTSETLYMWNAKNITGNQSSFNELVANTLKETAEEALLSSKKLAMKDVTSNSFPTLYTLAQCTPDISTSECQLCFERTIRQLPVCCDSGQGAKIFNPSCNFRYETYPFSIATTPQLPPSEPLPPPPPPSGMKTPPPPAPAPPPPPTTAGFSPPTIPILTKKSDRANSRTVVIIVVPTIIAVGFCMLSFVFFYWKKMKLEVKKDVEGKTDDAEGLQFSFATIRLATNNFSDNNKLGKGGFGAVYKGVLPDGQVIAVKRPFRISEQGEIEFKNEVLFVARQQHRNLVRLLGFCLGGKERLLIYEFLPNSSLDRFIFDANKRKLMNWNMRKNIIVGIARGILYLHEESQIRVVHRDLKAGNILLDQNMNPKISDFGTAKLVGIDRTQETASRIVGTLGYMAPEYAIHGRFSVKSDVFSFGVVVVEIITGAKISSFNGGGEYQNLLNFVWKNWNKGKAFDVIDPTMHRASSKREINHIIHIIHIALLCVQENVANRPTMASVILMLSSTSVTLPKPSRPGYVLHTTTGQGATPSGFNVPRESQDRPVNISVNEVSITELEPR